MIRTHWHLLAGMLALAALAVPAQQAAAQYGANAPWQHHLPYHLEHCETLRNLAATEDNLHFEYLSIDEDTGEVQMEALYNRAHTGPTWQLVQVSRTRDNRAWLLRNRSDSQYFGHYLGVDSDSGDVHLYSDEAENTLWAVRYAGKFRGYDAYYLQTLVRSEDGFDFHYLGLDPRTGEVILVNDPVDSVHWLKRPADDLPSEEIR